MSGIIHSRFVYLILFAFATILYANTVFHDFVLDDEVAITKSMYKKELKGFRPFLHTIALPGLGG